MLKYYNLSFDCLIFIFWNCFLYWDILSLSFVCYLRDILSLIFNWIVVGHIFLFGDLDLNSLSFILNHGPLILNVFNSRFTLNWSRLSLNRLLDNLLNRLDILLNLLNRLDILLNLNFNYRISSIITAIGATLEVTTGY